MSADSFLAFYGVRFEPDELQLGQLEDGTHPLIHPVRRAGLDLYSGNFGPEGGELYLLFVGKKLGVFGAEHLAERTFSGSALSTIFAETEEKLKGLGVSDSAALHLLWEPDW